MDKINHGFADNNYKRRNETPYGVHIIFAITGTFWISKDLQSIVFL